MQAAFVAVLMSLAAMPAEQARDGLLSYAIPAYPLHVEAKLELEVDIDGGGTVTAARPISTVLPILNTFALAAVKSWKFAPGYRGPRTEKVTISFDGERETDCETATTATYESPLTLHVKAVVATVQCVPHEPRECSFHHEPMTVQRVPILYGLLAFSGNYEQYAAAQQAEFPNAPSGAGGGCILQREKLAEVYVCKSCRRAKERWL